MVNIDKILAVISERGMKIKAFNEQAGLPRTFFGDYRAGKTRMTDERLQRIADILHTTPEYLKDETNIKEKPDSQSESELDAEVLELLRQFPPDKLYLAKQLLRTIKEEAGRDKQP